VPLSPAQLNALASAQAKDVKGKYSYTPGLGAFLAAGAGRELTVTFTPDETEDYTPASRTVKVNVSKRAVVTVRLAADASFPARFNRPLTWTAVGNSTTPLEYSFWRHDDSGWTEVQSYSPSATYRWTPRYGDVGAHALQVWVRRVGSTSAYDSWEGAAFAITGGPFPVATSLKPSIPLPLPAGSPVTWTAGVTGGVSPQCQFWRADADGWHMVQAYGGCQYAWTPKAADVGSHSLQAWVRNIDSLAPYENYQSVTFTVRPPDPVVVRSLVLQQPSSSSAGSAMTWVATGMGGMAPLQFQFWRMDSDGWHMVQDYSAVNTYTWKPMLKDVGQHTLQVWLRGAASTASYENWAGVTFAVGQPLPVKITAMTADVVLPASSGTTIRWTTTATGGMGALEYQFWRRDADGWHIAQEYGPVNTYAWTPARSDAGLHALQVWIRNVGSPAAYEAWTGTGEFTIKGS
jgi:hypothetical protein